MRKKIEAYLDHLAREGYAPATIRFRRATLALFAASGCSVERFQQRLSRGRHLARAQLSHLKNFLLFAARKRLAEAIHLPRVPIPAPQVPPSPEEVRRLLATLDGRTPISLRDRALVELLYSSGLRGCEAARLYLADIDLKERVARIHGKGGRQRCAPFGRQAADWLTLYLREGRPRLKPQGEALFVGQHGLPLQVAGIRERVRPLAPHALRRAAAAHCQAAGMNLREIQELLGHADLKNTARYTGFDRAELRRVLEARHPRGAMKVVSTATTTGCGLAPRCTRSGNAPMPGSSP